MPAGDAQGGNGQGLLLSGLDGSNPLGFLAAVGALRTVGLAESEADWRMKWLRSDGVWVPALLADWTVSADGLVDLLCTALRPGSTPEFDFSENLSVKPEEFGAQAEAARDQAQLQDRRGFHRGFRVRDISDERLQEHSGHRITDDERRGTPGLSRHHEEAGGCDRRGPLA